MKNMTAAEALKLRHLAREGDEDAIMTVIQACEAFDRHDTGHENVSQVPDVVKLEIGTWTMVEVVVKPGSPLQPIKYRCSGVLMAQRKRGSGLVVGRYA